MIISQKELGLRAGIDQFSASARINQYERGKHGPAFEAAKTLAKVLGVSIAYLYCDDEELADLIVIYGAKTEAKRKAIIDYANQLV